jgi:histidine ammonia-lyase
MLGLNGSITPLTAVPQYARPFPYQNKLARRLLNLIRGWLSVRFRDPARVRRAADHPGSLEFPQLQPAKRVAVEAYARLKKNILIQINSSDHNPAVVPGPSPSDSWEPDTPWLRLRFPDTFFTVIAPGDVLSADVLANAPPQWGSYTISET